MNEAFRQNWRSFSPIEKLVALYLMEGLSLDEVKGILLEELKLVACEILNKAIERVEENIISDTYIKSIMEKVAQNERRDKGTGKKPGTIE